MQQRGQSSTGRSFCVGRALGEGLSPKEAEAAAGGVAEGVATSRALTELARRSQVSVPVMDAVAAIVTGRAGLQDVMQQLLARPLGSELKMPSAFVR